MNNILVRTLTGAVFISVVIIGLAWNVWSAIGVMGLFSILGIWEYNTILQQPNQGPSKLLGVIGGIVIFIYLVVVAGSFPFKARQISLVVVATLPFIVMIAELFRQKENPLQNVALTLFGWLYVIIPLLLLVIMRGKSQWSYEAILPIGMLLIVWTNDTFAFLSGKFFGKTPLFPRLSPKKTWEGTIGGILFSLIAGYLLYFFSGIDLVFWLIAALIVAPAAILGDLFESMIKRSLGIKDSGTILPGHGGILDRFDAAYFAAPLFFIFQIIYFS